MRTYRNCGWLLRMFWIGLLACNPKNEEDMSYKKDIQSLDDQ